MKTIQITELPKAHQDAIRELKDLLARREAAPTETWWESEGLICELFQGIYVRSGWHPYGEPLDTKDIFFSLDEDCVENGFLAMPRGNTYAVIDGAEYLLPEAETQIFQRIMDIESV